jgi:predicted phage terminase large subunit-like protein
MAEEKSTDKLLKEIGEERLNRLLRSVRLADPSLWIPWATEGRYPWKHYPYLKIICDHVKNATEDVLKGKGHGGRIIVCAPSRHCKSWLTCWWLPLWYESNYPDHNVSMNCYGEDLATEWGRKCRNECDTNPKINLQLREDSQSAGRWNTTRGGGMFCNGVNGRVMGRGAQFVLVDDPLKSWEEAQSSIVKEEMWNWFTSTLWSRQEPNATFVISAQRLDEDDLCGRLTREFPGVWTVLNFPALAEDNDILGRKPGEALCPDRYSRDDLLRLKQGMLPAAWDAMYQQRPTRVGAGKFQRGWFSEYEIERGFYRLHRGEQNWLVDPASCERIATIDVAATTGESSDYNVVNVWDITPSFDMVFVECWRERREIPAVITESVRIYRNFHVGNFGVERDGVGQAVYQALAAKGVTVTPLSARKQGGDKVMRAQSAMIRASAGYVHIPKADWVREWLDEITAFPQVTHDDRVDAFAWAAIMVHKMGGGVPMNGEDDAVFSAVAKKESESAEAAEHPGATVSVGEAMDDAEAQRWLSGN